MDIAHLRYFKNLVEYESFSKAAKASYVTQPALSAAIRSLENELGFSLVDRTQAGAKPTDAGRKLYRAVSASLDEIDRTITECRKESAPKDTVTIGVDPASLGGSIAALLRTAASEALPNAALRFRQTDESSLLSELRRGLIDIALVAGSERDDDLTFAKVLPCQLAACVSPRSELAGADTLKAADLVSKKLLACRKSSPFGRRIATWIDHHHLDAIFDFEDEATLVSMVRAHDRSVGLTCIPNGTPARKGALRLIPLEEPDVTFFVYAALPRTAPLGCDASLLKSKLASRFIDAQANAS